MDLHDRVVGCVVGLALGDALGAPFEGLRARDVPDPLPAFGLPRFNAPPGSTTDDTAMARNLVRSLAARGGLDGEDLLSRHIAWFLTGPPDIGNLTYHVLRRLMQGADPFQAARLVWEERGPEVSAGNGSVMYCGPLGAAYANRPDELEELAPALSALTHHDQRCRTGVLAVTRTVASLVRGEERFAAVETSLSAVQHREGGEELEFLVEAAGTVRPVDGPDMGFCLYAAAVGLQAVAAGDPFEPTLRAVVRLGGDTDTNGAVAGALLGASAGRSSLPGEWLDRLIDREAIEREAEGLIDLARRT